MTAAPHQTTDYETAAEPASTGRAQRRVTRQSAQRAGGAVGGTVGADRDSQPMLPTIRSYDDRFRPAPTADRQATAPVAPHVNEAALMDAIMSAARRLNWLVFHDYDTRRTSLGFPDLVMLKYGRSLVIATKTERERLRPEQATWLHKFNKAGIRAYVVRPKDLNGVLEELGKGER